jgi:hypothetical protein
VSDIAESQPGEMNTILIKVCKKKKYWGVASFQCWYRKFKLSKISMWAEAFVI